MLRDRGGGGGVGGVRALARAAGGSSSFEGVRERGLEALDGGMEINAIKDPEGGLDIAALVLEAAEESTGFLHCVVCLFVC